MADGARSKVTILAVAERAGVSPSTVSRVMNGRFSVAPDIAERVRRAVAELDYSPNQRARSLVLGRSTTIAILVPDLRNPTFQSILHGLTSAAGAQGFRVLVADSSEKAGSERALAAELRSRTDAIVLCAPRMPESELIELLPSLAPAVMINRDSSLVTAPIVSADYERGIRLLAEHLFALGHRRLAYLQGNPDSASNRYRIAGLARFRDEHPEVEVETIECGVTFEHGFDAAGPVVASGATGCLAFNDLVAMGLVSALSERGVRVPADLSITGFDDIPFARFTTPPLTTAAVPVEDLGAQAWSRLSALIDGDAPEENIVLQPVLRARGSTAPPPPGGGIRGQSPVSVV